MAHKKEHAHKHHKHMAKHHEKEHAKALKEVKKHGDKMMHHAKMAVGKVGTDAEEMKMARKATKKGSKYP